MLLYPFESLRTRNGLLPDFLLPGSRHLKPTLLTVLCALALAAPAQAGASCRLPAGRTVASGRVAKLISVPTPQGSALYGCIRRTGRKVALDDNFSSARLNGRWAAWQRPGRPGHWRIAVHDLRTGHERLVDGHVATASLRLTARGTVVWAQEPDRGGFTPLFAN